MATSWIDTVVSAGSIRGPYTRPLLPSLGRTLREESWPLPIAIRSLKLRELAVLERRAMEAGRTTWKNRIFRLILKEG